MTGTDQPPILQKRVKIYRHPSVFRKTNVDVSVGRTRTTPVLGNVFIGQRRIGDLSLVNVQRFTKDGIGDKSLDIHVTDPLCVEFQSLLSRARCNWTDVVVPKLFVSRMCPNNYVSRLRYHGRHFFFSLSVT